MTENVRQTAPEQTWGTLRVTCDNSPTGDGTGPQNGPEETEDMKSIDNLREYVLTAPSICSTTRAILVGYIDGIEREVADMVPLPVDEDGEVWHVGDLAVGEVNPRNPKEVERMLWYGPDSGWQLETDTIIFPCPERVRHHHAPTVEDVLEEFVAHWMETHHDDIPALKAEYAAKLTLRGDE